ncbi:putative ORFan [Tupanvirus deep ocean]|uniref:ORFan n=2 Tax=Tupanvirus TaxID=2094720 RepID=A0AC62A9E6_9VIRU|nr:putative ORFan [Tupanvirus deep ocean]QKU34397.1 putative ORFan [Tupanvirus deep ocean]
MYYQQQQSMNYNANARTGFVSENFEGKRKNIKLSPVAFGPTAISYEQWKINNGFQ